ncbi:putative acetyltransferase EpsM [compost metagenome]
MNPFTEIGKGVIINSGAVIEHECKVEDFCHIAPGATLLGNVQVGAYSFVGGNAVVKQGVKIGSNVIVGAGAVVLNDIPDNSVVAGNPAKLLK